MQIILIFEVFYEFHEHFSSLFVGVELVKTCRGWREQCYILDGKRFVYLFYGFT